MQTSFKKEPFKKVKNGWIKGEKPQSFSIYSSSMLVCVFKKGNGAFVSVVVEINVHIKHK